MGSRDAADQNFDYMFKLLIIGNSSVGKTSFLFRYADDSFTSAFVSTVGIDFKVKTVFRHDKRVKLQIWDTAGQERYRTITTAYYRGAMGFILMYDVTNEDSFNAVQDWVTLVRGQAWQGAVVVLVGNKCDCQPGQRRVDTKTAQKLANELAHAWHDATIVLVGNKCDLADYRVISELSGQRLAEEIGLEFFETSAKENINVKAVFERLVDVICDKMAESLECDPNLAAGAGNVNETDSLRDQVATLRRENDALRQQRDAFSLACAESAEASKEFKSEVVDLHYLLAMSMVKERENDARAVIASLNEAAAGAIHTAALTAAEQIWVEFCTELDQSRIALKQLRTDCRSKLDTQEEFKAANVKTQFQKLVPRSPRKPDLKALKLEAETAKQQQQQQMPPPPPPPSLQPPQAATPAARPRSVNVSLPCNSLPGPIGPRAGTTASAHGDLTEQQRGALKYMPVVQKILPYVTVDQKEQVRRLDCDHLFHDACIRRWFQECSVCPTCRNYSLLPDEYPKLW
uniref:RING-type domain-containing protein n=1 Tax=Macrostomum lignano TaxID=282301 RepID=A0A1I8HRK1_9PLAT